MEPNTTINHFLRLLKSEHPNYYDRISLSVSSKSNYQQYLGKDGRMRAEINYNLPVEHTYEISFPSVGTLYYDITFYIDCIWGCSENVLSTHYYDLSLNMVHKFEFTL